MDAFALFANESELRFEVDRSIGEKLFAGRYPNAKPNNPSASVTIVVELDFERVGADLVTIESDSRVADLTQAIDGLTVIRDRLKAMEGKGGWLLSIDNVRNCGHVSVGNFRRLQM
ncbi:hypothetical protein [Aeromicrobium sp. Sec7.5]|uniref:hypothetical protein n=1 Tax=Aeromicrobium sp. Sec7.5 TaxID=3121276 RepID=UPI002FE4F210